MNAINSVNPNSMSQDDFDDAVGAHFDAGCDECVSSRDAYLHELEWRAEGHIALLEQNVKDLRAAVDTHKSALLRLTNPVAIANCAQLLADTRVQLSLAEVELARFK
jgi:hypothetical protein